MRPQLLLGDAGAELPLHHGHRRLARGERAAHGLDLVGRFDRPRELHRRLPLVHADALRPERFDALGVDMVEREAPVAAAVRAHQVGELRGPTRSVLGDAIAALEEIPAAPRPHLVDQIEVRRQVRAAMEVEHDHRPVGRDEGVARRVVQAPDLHVGAVGGVAHVDRIGDHDAGVVARGQLCAHARETIGAHRRQIRQLQPERLPLAERERPRPEVAERAEAAPSRCAAQDLGLVAGHGRLPPRLVCQAPGEHATVAALRRPARRMRHFLCHKCGS